VYATLNGYRWDDFKVYVYKSDNYGQTWENISGNIPMSPVNVIVEDPKKDNVLYVGTDNGAYVSLDGGSSYQAFAKGLPAVAIHDMKIQKRENHLLLGTHGRSIYKTDITPLQSLNSNTGTTLYDVAAVSQSRRWGNSFSMWQDAFEPSVDVPYFSSYAGKFELLVKDENGKELQKIPVVPSKGLGVIAYDMTITEKGKKTLEKANNELNIRKATNGKYYLPKGKYTLVLLGGSGNAETASTVLEVK